MAPCPSHRTVFVLHRPYVIHVPELPIAQPARRIKATAELCYRTCTSWCSKRRVLYWKMAIVPMSGLPATNGPGPSICCARTSMTEGSSAPPFEISHRVANSIAGPHVRSSFECGAQGPPRGHGAFSRCRCSDGSPMRCTKQPPASPIRPGLTGSPRRLKASLYGKTTAVRA